MVCPEPSGAEHHARSACGRMQRIPGADGGSCRSVNCYRRGSEQKRATLPLSSLVGRRLAAGSHAPHVASVALEVDDLHVVGVQSPPDLAKKRGGR